MNAKRVISQTEATLKTTPVPATPVPATTGGTVSATPVPPPATPPAPYKYLNFIKSPSEMGMSDAGNLPTIEKDINGLIAYVELLIDGTSPASKAPNNGPLGNQFFVKTSATCNATVGGFPTTVDRHIYVNNVPTGGIGAAPGANLPEFRGLVPGMMSGMSSLDPTRMAESIANSGNPDCVSVTLNVTDSSYNTVPSTNYITVTDAKYIDPCSFTNCVNPITNGVCHGKTPPTQGFTNRSDLLFSEIERDYVSQMFLLSTGILSIYILHLLINNRFR